MIDCREKVEIDSRVFTWTAGLLMMLFSELIGRRWIQIFVCQVCAVLCLVAQSRPTLCDPLNCSLPGSSVHWNSPGKCTGMGCHALLQGIFPTQGSNPGLSNCGQILYHLSYSKSPPEERWSRPVDLASATRGGCVKTVSSSFHPRNSDPIGLGSTRSFIFQIISR